MSGVGQSIPPEDASKYLVRRARRASRCDVYLLLSSSSSYRSVTLSLLQPFYTFTQAVSCLGLLVAPCPVFGIHRVPAASSAVAILAPYTGASSSARVFAALRRMACV